MEEQKDTKNIWIVMTITFFTVSIVFGILLYRSEKVIKEMQQTVAESVTVPEQQDVNASADPVRLMDGMVQVQKDKEWVDYCTIEEFAQSDPVEAGKQKMSDLIKSNQDAVNAGTLLEDVNSEFAMLEKAATREVIMEPQTEVSWKMETDNTKNTTNNPNKKKDNGKNTASKVNGKNQAGKGNTVSGQNAAGTATPAETQPGADTSMQQPASGTSSGSTPAEGNASTGDNASSGGSPSGGGSSAGSSSSSGGGALRIQHLPVGMVVQIRLVEQQAHHQQEQIQEAMELQAAVHRTVVHPLVDLQIPVEETAAVIRETLVQDLPVVMGKILDGRMIFYKRRKG